MIYNQYGPLIDGSWQAVFWLCLSELWQELHTQNLVRLRLKLAEVQEPLMQEQGHG